MFIYKLSKQNLLIRPLSLYSECQAFQVRRDACCGQPDWREIFICRPISMCRFIWPHQRESLFTNVTASERVAQTAGVLSQVLTLVVRKTLKTGSASVFTSCFKDTGQVVPVLNKVPYR